MRGRGNLVGGLLTGLLVLLGIVIAIPVNVVSGYFPASVVSLRPLWIGLAAGGALVIVAVTLMSRWQEGRVPDASMWQVPPVTDWVDRKELAKVLSALTAADAGAVALTTGLVGAGGFGKTTLAARACQDRAVRRRFRGGIFWVTVGQDLGGAGLATKISDVTKNVGGEGPAFTSPEQAGQALAGALAARGRTLLVADDVWTAGQLEPFTWSGRQGRLLVTTRRPAVLAGASARRIQVDAVTGVVARRILTRDLPPMAGRLERELLELTGGWPLLLSLVHNRLADDLRRPGGDINASAAAAARRLRRVGPAALDVTDSGSRHTAVAATIEYSLDALEACDWDRFLELGIFAEDAEVPLAVIALLWQATGGLSEAAAESLCERLDGLSLLSLALAGDARVMVLHDVIRDFALSRLGSARCAAVQAALVDAARQLTGPARSGEPDCADGLGAGSGTAWWRLPQTAESDYLWQNLTYHMQAAGLEPELDQVCCDLRFLAIKLRRHGPPGVEADLARSAAPAARRLRRVIAQDAHLLAPIEPTAALTTILTSRLGGVPEVADQLPALRSDLLAWTAWPDWPLPDQPDALIRTMVGHGGHVNAVAIAPDGTWLATAGSDGTARTWAADGTLRATVTGHRGGVFRAVTAVAIAPDGTWLATTSADGTVRTWAADGTARATLTGHDRPVRAVAIAPDGTWLATASDDGTVRTWAADGTPRATLTGHHGGVAAVAIAPDGTWLATASDDRTARTWAADGTPRATLTGHHDGVNAVAIAPDGTWLATASNDRTARTWAADGTPRATLTGHHGWVNAVAIAPDGTWLATGAEDRTVRTWAADGTLRATLTGHHNWVRAVAIAPDGTWLATASDDGTARIWAADGTPRATLTGHHEWVNAVAIAPDGTWLATASADGTVRTWAADGTPRATLTGHDEWVPAVAIAPDGTWLATANIGRPRSRSADGTQPATQTGHYEWIQVPDGTWLATASNDGTVRTWAADGTPRATLTGHHGGVAAVAIAPDGTWLATASNDGTARTWAADGTPRATLTGHHGGVAAVAIAPDGTWLATASNDGTARTWAADGTPRATLTGHHGGVAAVAIAPDGTWLATASDDGTARTWAADGTPRATLTGHHGGVNAVAIAPDGTWLATGAEDRTARIWASGAVGANVGSATAIRVDSTVRTCAWLPGGTNLCIAGDQGMYLFSLHPPDGGPRIRRAACTGRS